MKYKSLSLIISLFLFFCAETHAKSTARVGSESGNAGGVIRRNGQVLTFGKANVTVIERGLTEVSEIPGMAFLHETISKLPIPETLKGKLANAYLPPSEGTQRRYFRISKLSPEKEAELNQVYREMLKDKLKEGDQIEVAALTVGNETYLKDQFFDLDDPISQATNLWHEMTWVLFPYLEYKEVSDFEVNFERYVREFLPSGKFYDPVFIERMSWFFDEKYLPITLAARDDFKDGEILLKRPYSGSLDAVKVRANQITLNDFMGPIALLDFYVFNRAESYYKSDDREILKNETQEALIAHVIAMKNANPGLSFYRALLSTIQRHRIKLDFISLYASMYPQDLSKLILSLDSSSWKMARKSALSELSVESFGKLAFRITKASRVDFICDEMRNSGWELPCKGSGDGQGGAFYRMSGFKVPVQHVFFSQDYFPTIGPTAHRTNRIESGAYDVVLRIE